MRAVLKRGLRALLLAIPVAWLAACQQDDSAARLAADEPIVTPQLTLPGADTLQPAQSASAGRAPFDYWVLALSWSPEYCASAEARPGSKQCAQAREFIVHGLWPQYERGYPEFCDTQTRVPERTADRLAPWVPDRGLVFHQWKKHGSCSGLGVDGYFEQVERAAGAVRIPSKALARAATQRLTRTELEREFIALNPGLNADAIAFECRSGYLREVRVCLDHDLKPRACGVDVREGCARELNVRAAQGARR